MPEQTEKPPTQGVGVQGFRSDVYACDEVKIPWHALIHLPKFQMYACEKAGPRYGDCNNVMEWILGYVQDQCHINETALYQDYCQWHDQIGRWPLENPLGEVVNS